MNDSFEASKWIKIPLLADETEFAALFDLLGSFDLYSLGSIVQKQEAKMSREGFLLAMKGWISRLQEGCAPTLAELKPTLACALTRDPDSIWLQPLAEERVIVKIRRPVIQIAAHFFSYDSQEMAFHSMIFGKTSLFWGVQFSYPQIFLDPSEGYRKVDDSFVNTELFQRIRRWSRDATRATPFLANGRTVHVPIRLGKRCFSWIHQHPQLQSRGLKVIHAS